MTWKQMIENGIKLMRKGCELGKCEECPFSECCEAMKDPTSGEAITPEEFYMNKEK